MPGPAAPPAPVSGQVLGLTAALAVCLLLVGSLLLLPLGVLSASPLVELLALAAPALVLAARHGGARRFLAIHRPSGPAMVGAVLAGASLWLVVLVVVAPILQHLPDHAATEERLAPLTDAQHPLALRLLLFAAIPAIGEELLCRGVLCRHLSAQLGRGAGIGISALYFAALHMSFSQGISVLFIGVALGCAALWSGSIVTAMILHAANNTAIVLFSAPELTLGEGLANERWFAIYLIAAILLSAGGMELMRRSGEGSANQA